MAKSTTYKVGERGRRKRESEKQLGFRYRTWGGRRKGAGRKKEKGSGVSHQSRGPLASRWPVHVTLKLRGELPRIRNRKYAPVIRQCMIDTNAAGFVRVVHFVVLARHLHMIVEAKSREAMSRGMQGFGVRLARRLNKKIGRQGGVFADRYHEHILRTPREVRNAICYVLRNQARHEVERDTAGGLPGVDIYSSGHYLDGWRNFRGRPREGVDPPVARARTWLLGKGWRRCGLIGLEEIPGNGL